jgi:Tol biopolymer transport system component
MTRLSRWLRTVGWLALVSSAPAACGGDRDNPTPSSEVDASDARPSLDARSEADASAEEPRGDGSPDRDVTSESADVAVERANDGSTGDVTSEDGSTRDATMPDVATGDGATRDASPDVSNEAATADAPPDAAPEAADASSSLSDACTDQEWAAVTSPLVVVRYTDRYQEDAFDPSSLFFVLADLHGRCRRRVVGVDVTLSPDGTRLAFQTVDGRLWVATPRTISAPVPIPAPRASSTNFSPDGRWLIFESQEQEEGGSPTRAVYVVDADAPVTLKRLPGAVESSWVSWSPSSKQYVYTDGRRILVDCPDRDCSRATPQLPSGVNSFFVWAPDSSQVAAATHPSTAGGAQLFVVDAASGAVTQVTHDPDPDQNIFDFQWSPSGNKLVFFRVTIPFSGPWSNRDIVVVCADGSCRRSLTSQMPPGPGDVDSPSWAPDGTRVAFRWQAQNGTPLHVLTVCPDGSCATDLGEASNPIWSKGGPLLYAQTAAGGVLTGRLVAFCPDGSCSHDLGAAMGYEPTVVGLSHGPGGLAFHDNDEALFVAFGPTTATRVSRDGEAAGFARWSFDDRTIVYKSYSSYSIEAACADGSCHSTVLGPPPPGNAYEEMVGLLLAPAP